jgi:hypothetical protein
MMTALRTIFSKRTAVAAVAFALLVCPALCKAEARCPWLNVATASGALNGPALMSVQQAADNGTTCMFQYRNKSAVYNLRISVSDVKDASKGAAPYEDQCASMGEPLRAIGNEAVMCAANKGHSHGEQVIGRVRDKIFILVLSTSARNDPSMSGEVVKDKLENLAEQVAGSLF